jgi:drug/metabolite transporter (DMT)-like permease
MIARMSDHLIGQSCALLTALTWAYALVLFKIGGERVPPVSLNLYKNAVGLLLLILTLAGMLLVKPATRGVFETPLGDFCLLLLSGVIGIALADTIFFHALNLIGVGLIAVVDCAYSPLAILFAWTLLGEQLEAWHYVGASLIVVGVFTASRHKVPVNRTRGQIVGGMLLAMLAVGMMAFGIVMAKPVLETSNLIWATSVRMLAGATFLALFALLGANWRAHWAVFRPSRSWKVILPASVLGTYICMILWVAGFKYTYASVAAVLNQTSVIFASIFAALILREHFGGRKITALALSVTGVSIVTLGGELWQLVRAG